VQPMKLSIRRGRAIALAVAVCCVTAPAMAQGSPEQRVLELNQQAMDAYMHLEIERAKGLLIEALGIAERAGIEGRALARTYINLGVVTVGGERDQQSAFEFFKAALDADPSVAPDPSTTTPEVDEAYELARGRYEMETGRRLPRGGDLTPEELLAGVGQDGDGPSDDPRDASSVYDYGELPRTFFHVGFSFGGATARSGKPADPQPSDDCLGENRGAPHCDSYRFPAEDAACDGTEACVRVNQPGWLPVLGIKLTFGHYILPRLAFATTLRFAFNGGEGFMSQWLVGARMQYLFVGTGATGFNLAGFVGGSVGQIQVQPDQGRGAGGERMARPFITSGPGSFQAGAVLGYRFARNFGLHLTPEMHVFLPTTMVVIEVTAGIEAAF
jgi:hypothetical protein